MCLIVDANAAGRFLARSSSLRDWLLGAKGQPRLVAAGLLKEELARLDSVRRLLVELNRVGRLRSVEADPLRRAEARLRTRAPRSNDVHVLALAIVSGARTLATFDDSLAHDFRNPSIISRPRGKVYRDPERHSHLLRHTPVSCGVAASEARRGQSHR